MGRGLTTPLAGLGRGTQWEALTRFIEDGRLPLSNNAAERDMRPVAMGQRNFFYVGSVRGGEAIAILLRLLRSAILCGHNPWDCLKDSRTYSPACLRPRRPTSPICFPIAGNLPDIYSGTTAWPHRPPHSRTSETGDLPAFQIHSLLTADGLRFNNCKQFVRCMPSFARLG